MNIFQPAIDITDKALEEEIRIILEKISELSTTNSEGDELVSREAFITVE